MRPGLPGHPGHGRFRLATVQLPPNIMNKRNWLWLLFLALSVFNPCPGAGIGARFSPHPGFTGRAIMLRDGATLAYYVRAGSPTVVLVPGTLGDRRTFLDTGLVDHLLPTLGIVIIESRGQGKSWPPPAPEQCSIERYADDVLEVVGELGLKHWYIGGHSLGGMIAIEIAGRSPPGLEGVITLEGWPHYTVEGRVFPMDRANSAKPRNGKVNWRDIHRAEQRWTVQEQQMLVAAWKKWTPGRQILQETHYPVLTIWGDRGMRILPDRQALGLPEKGNIEVRWIRGSDHFGLVTARFAGPIAAEINAFIADVEMRRHP